MATTEQTEPGHVIVHGTAAGFAQEIEIGSHELYADEPVSFGVYARKRSWPLEKIIVSLRHSRIHAADCEDCETKEGKIDRIDLDIQLTGSLTDEQRAKLIEVAGKCPVHQTLTSEINIKTRAV